jgi:hypothetical protein
MSLQMYRLLGRFQGNDVEEFCRARDITRVSARPRTGKYVLPGGR